MKPAIFFPVILIILAIAILSSFALGRYPVSLDEIIVYLVQEVSGQPLLNQDSFQKIGTLIVDIRLPRIAAAVLVGAALAVAGATFQAMFVNPLVSPGLLGVLAGASFGAALAMVLSTKWIMVQAGAFFFGLAAVGLAVVLAEMYRGDKLLLLILSGAISAALFTALLSIVKLQADPYDQLPAITYWLMGGLSMVNGRTVMAVAPPIIICIGVILCLSRHLNILTMGDEEARALGVRVRTLRLTFILAATLASSLTVAVGGLIGWVGLVIPHMGRMLIGPDNRYLLPASALMGALFLLLVDNVSRLLFQVEIPLGILTALVGIPFFAVILRNAQRGWS